LALPNAMVSVPSSSFSSDLGNSRDQPQHCWGTMWARCAPVREYLLPLLVSSGQKAKGCGNGMDSGLFLPPLLCHGVNWNRILASEQIRGYFIPLPPPHQLNSPDLHQTQERPLAKVRWTCPPQSTPWRCR